MLCTVYYISKKEVARPYNSYNNSVQLQRQKVQEKLAVCLMTIQHRQNILERMT